MNAVTDGKKAHKCKLWVMDDELRTPIRDRRTGLLLEREKGFGAGVEEQCTVVWNKQESRRKPLARPFPRLLAPDCSLRSGPLLRSLVRSLAHFLARGTVNDWLAILFLFFSIFDHSALGKLAK